MNGGDAGTASHIGGGWKRREAVTALDMGSPWPGFDRLRHSGKPGRSCSRANGHRVNHDRRRKDAKQEQKRETDHRESSWLCAFDPRAGEHRTVCKFLATVSRLHSVCWERLIADAFTGPAWQLNCSALRAAFGASGRLPKAIA